MYTNLQNFSVLDSFQSDFNILFVIIVNSVRHNVFWVNLLLPFHIFRSLESFYTCRIVRNTYLVILV